MNVIDIFKRDHRRARDLFARFGKTTDLAARAVLVRTLCLELKIHAEAEECVFRPAFQRSPHDMPGATAEGSVVERRSLNVLINDVAASSPEESFFEARFARLRERVEEYMLREEREMLSKLRKTDLDLEEVGAMFARIQAGIRARNGGMTPILTPIRAPRRGRAASRVAPLAAAA